MSRNFLIRETPKAGSSSTGCFEHPAFLRFADANSKKQWSFIMSDSLSCAGANAYGRLEQIIPKLRQVADWTEGIGRELKSDAFVDSIPFTLRCLASEVEQIRDDLKPFLDTGQG